MAGVAGSWAAVGWLVTPFKPEKRELGSRTPQKSRSWTVLKRCETYWAELRLCRVTP